MQERDNFEQKTESFRLKQKPLWRKFAFGFWIFFLIFILVAIVGSLIYKTGFTFSQINVMRDTLPLAEDEPTPTPDNDRINILVLGLRGEGDPDGGLLTDTMIVLSIKKSTGQGALISIPRDLYVTMPGETYKEKINYAYALGFEKRQGAAGGLLYSKIAVSRVTGLGINYAISVNHQAFKEFVDILGGIDIRLDKPFIENQQWVRGGDIGSSSAFFIQTETLATTSSSSAVKIQKWVFEIPAGTSHLDGNTALYFIRARYSSNDFDRAVRQQQVMLAIKDKALSLGVLTNPMKIYELLGSLGRNIRTDMSWNDMQKLIGLAQDISDKKIIRRAFDTSPEGLLYQSAAENGAYILLPQGDNFSKIQEASKNIFN